MIQRFYQLRHRITHRLQIGEEWLFANPKIVLGLIFGVTLLFSLAVPKLRVYSDFADLLPQNHKYIQTYNRIKENFGGANMIVMAIEVDQGTIFNDDTLELIHEATQGVDNLSRRQRNHEKASAEPRLSVNETTKKRPRQRNHETGLPSSKPRKSACVIETTILCSCH